MVVTSSPSCITASDRQELILTPPTRTVQAPHWPWSQPFFEPVSFRCSRSASRRVVRGSRSSALASPLTVIVVFKRWTPVLLGRTPQGRRGTALQTFVFV